MSTTRHRLYKKEKLRGAISVDTLFAPASQARGDVSSALAYPLKMVWRHNPGRRNDADICFVITVPKRRLRHAVDRVTMRRRIRESFRLNRPEPLFGAGKAAGPQPRRLDVAFVYVANKPEPYARTNRAMQRLLGMLPKQPACGDNTQPVPGNSPG